jgi:hypothetical protein
MQEKRDALRAMLVKIATRMHNYRAQVIENQRLYSGVCTGVSLVKSSLVYTFISKEASPASIFLDLSAKIK